MDSPYLTSPPSITIHITHHHSTITCDLAMPCPVVHRCHAIASHIHRKQVGWGWVLAGTAYAGTVETLISLKGERWALRLKGDTVMTTH